MMAMAIDAPMRPLQDLREPPAPCNRLRPQASRRCPPRAPEEPDRPHPRGRTAAMRRRAPRRGPPHNTSAPRGCIARLGTSKGAKGQQRVASGGYDGSNCWGVGGGILRSIELGPYPPLSFQTMMISKGGPRDIMHSRKGVLELRSRISLEDAVPASP